MSDYIGQIRTKRLGNTGITEDDLRGMYVNKGGFYMAIVEVQVDAIHENKDGQRTVDLVLHQVELADREITEPYLRGVTKALHQNRVLKADDQQLTIETGDDLAPSVEEAISAHRAHLANQPHVYDPADDSDHCSQCGEDLEHDLHVVLTDPEVEPDEDEPELDDADQDADQDAADREPEPAGV